MACTPFENPYAKKNKKVKVEFTSAWPDTPVTPINENGDNAS
jgi:hypothetical protein